MSHGAGIPKRAGGPRSAGGRPCDARAAGRWIVAAAFIAAAAWGLAAAAAERVVLQLQWDHQFQFAGYYAALWTGAYAEAGFDVEIRSFMGADGIARNVYQEVADGRAQFGVGSSDILVQRDKGQRLQIIAPYFQRSAMAIVFRKDSGITAPADIVGRRVMVGRPEGITGTELGVMLRADGVDPRSLPLIAKSGGFYNVVAGIADAAPAYTIDLEWARREHGVDFGVLDPVVYGIDFYGDTLFTHERYSKADPARVLAFRDASTKGWAYALAHSEDIADRIANELPRTMAIRDVRGFNRAQVDGVRRVVLLPLVELGYLSTDRWRRMHQQLKASGVISGEFDEGVVFDAGRDENDRLRRLTAVLGGLVLAGGLAGVFAWIHGLHRMVRRRTRELSAEAAERARVAEDLRRRTRLFDAILGSVSDGVVACDASGQATFVSRSMIPYSSGMPYSRQGMACYMADGTTSIAEDLLPLSQALKGRTVENQDVVVITGDGQPRSMLANATPMRDEAGAVVGAVAVFRDVTERKRIEDELRERSALLEAIFENAPAAILIKDLQERYLRVNRVFLEWNDTAPGQIIGQTRESLYPMEGAPGIHDREVIRTRRAIPREFRYEHRDGVRRDIYETKFPILDSRSNLICIGGIALDVTPLKDAERRLAEAKHQAEAANRAKSEFLANMSHELRTPLNSILGFSEMMMGEYFGPVGGERYLEYAHDIHESGALLLRIIGDILDLARVEAGVARLDEETVVLPDLIEAVARLLRPRAAERALRLEIDIPGDVPPLKADPVRLKQVLLNIGSNAVKFTGTGGQVVLSVRADRDSGVTVAIADTGIGMTETDLSIALEPFGQVQSAYQRGQQGTGLGLPIAKSLVELHGGRLKVDSRPGSGTTVEVWLPPERMLSSTFASQSVREAQITWVNGQG